VSILAGSDDAQVQAWSAPGQRRWAVTLPRNHYMPARVQGLALADLDGDGRLWPIAGTAAWRVHALGPEGALRWTFDTAAHAVTGVAAGDLNGDGRQEVVCSTVYFCVPAITPDGGRLWEDEDYNDFWRAGPNFRTLALADVDGDGRLEVITAADDTCVHCLSAQGEKRWAVSIGDEPAAVVLGHGAIWTAGIDGQVQRLDGHGRRLSCVRLGGHLTAMACLTDGVAVADAAGRVTRLDPHGEPRDSLSLEGRISHMARNGDALAVAHGAMVTLLPTA